MPSVEVMLVTPKSTAVLETTTSLAEMPAISATTICQKPQTDGGEEGYDKPADHRAKGVSHVLGVPGGAKVQQHPHDNGGHKDGGARLGEIVLYLFPHINGNGAGAGSLVFRQLNEQGVFSLLLPVDQVHHKGAGDGHHNAQQVHGVGHQQRVVGEEQLGEQHIDGQPGRCRT